MSTKHYKTGVMLFYIVLILAVLLLFYNFIVQNTERIQSQNRVYAQDAARQIALKVDAQLKSSLDLMDTYAYFLENTLEKPEITAGMLNELEKNSPFDGLTFTYMDGINIGSGGQINNVEDREYFMEGSKGTTGIDVVLNSRIAHQPVLGFYKPITYKGKIFGVLHGTYYSRVFLRQLLDNTYFGAPGEVFLCQRDGSIVASNTGIYKGNIISHLLLQDMIDAKIKAEMEKIFRDGGDAVFSCDEDNNIDNLCIMTLPNHDFVIVQTFPVSVTTQMIESANIDGIQLEIGLIIVFVIYVIFLLLRARAQKRGLEKENREQAWVIKGLNTLFSSRYCIVDLETGHYDFVAGSTPTNQNLEAHSLFASFIEKDSHNIVEEENRAQFISFFNMDNLRRILEKRESLTYECHMQRGERQEWENKIMICLERNNGLPSKVLFVSQNVTDLKMREIQTKKRLSIMDRKERQYRLAVTSNAFYSYEFNVSKDLQEADVLVSDSGREFSLVKCFGLELPCRASEFFNKFQENVLPESRQRFAKVSQMKYMLNSFKKGRKEIDMDFWCRDIHDKEMCIRQAFYLTVDDLSGDIIALAVAKNITDMVISQREQTRALQDALLLARHANEAKSTFLSNMSHDIRTPMNAIIGFASIAASRLDNRELVRDSLQKVLASSNHLLNLINDILDMSRIESGKLQTKEQVCNISEIVHNLVTIIQPQAKAKQMRMFIDTFEVLNETVTADPLKLNQVFINLLSNAVKYTPAGGTITFRLTQKPSTRVGYADYVFIVQDNGVGMSREFVKHIFEPFTRETTTTISGIQGTGLGMAITKKIIELMNGNITVESEPGKGSTFTVTFTLQIHENGAEGSEEIRELAGMRTLVADDDYHVCDSLNRMLKKLGVRSEWTTTGREAIYRAQIAHDEKDPFKTFIIDWQMPEMNGIETARQIRRLVGDDAPIIILTAYEWADMEEEAYSAGVTAFCASPCSCPICAGFCWTATSW